MGKASNLKEKALRLARREAKEKGLDLPEPATNTSAAVSTKKKNKSGKAIKAKKRKLAKLESQGIDITQIAKAVKTPSPTPSNKPKGAIVSPAAPRAAHPKAAGASSVNNDISGLSLGAQLDLKRNKEEREHAKQEERQRRLVEQEEAKKERDALAAREMRLALEAKNNTPDGAKLQLGGAALRKPSSDDRPGIDLQNPCVFIQSLPTDTNEEAIKTLFGKFGKVQKVVLNRKLNDSLTGTGFIEFVSEAERDRVLDREAFANSKIKFKNDGSPNVAVEGLGFALDGNRIFVNIAIPKEKLLATLDERKTLGRDPRNLKLAEIGTVDTTSSTFKTYGKDFSRKYNSNQELKKSRMSNVNMHIDPMSITFLNCPSGLTKVIVANSIVDALMSTEAGQALVERNRDLVLRRGPQEDESRPQPRTIGTKLVAFKAIKSILILHDTKITEGASRGKFQKGKEKGVVYVKFNSHEIARLVLERANCSIDFFVKSKEDKKDKKDKKDKTSKSKSHTPMKSKRIIAEFTMNDKRLEKIHEEKKMKRDMRAKGEMEKSTLFRKNKSLNKSLNSTQKSRKPRTGEVRKGNADKTIQKYKASFLSSKEKQNRKDRHRKSKD